MEYRQSMRMEQKLLHSPQMIQAMQVLQLTTPELIERIEAEIEENPFLEFADSERSEPSEQSDGNDSEEERFEEELSSLDRLLEAEGRTGISAIDRDEGWDSIQNLPAPETHTQDSLLAELRVADHPTHFLAAAEAILADLDERGFLADGCEGVEQRHGIPLHDIRCTLSLLRQIAHPALGAETLQECYLLQLDSLSEMDALIRTLIEDHFEELLSNRLPHIAQEMGCSMSDLRSALEVLSMLDTRPFPQISVEDAGTVAPDVHMEANESGGYSVRLTRDAVPEIRLSKAAHEALEKSKKDKRLREFLLQRIEKARWFLDAVGQRRETLTKICRALADRQQDFLTRGPEGQAPLKMQEIAEELGIHISTVSRAVKGKWAQTPRGILSLKQFFTGGQATKQGSQTTRAAILQRIETLIEQEDRSAPFSDEELARILSRRDGVSVARRTITKYRKSLDIPSSTLRRDHTGGST